MSSSDFEYSPDGDWDDTPDTSWGEKDWRSFLAQHSKEVAKFRKFYGQKLTSQNRLDEIAPLMSWEPVDWRAGEWVQDELDANDEDDFNRFEPFTVHRHPVFIITRALYMDLREGWEHLMDHVSVQFPSRFVWRLSKLLNEGEYESMMGIHAMDLGDFNLSICHLKMAMSKMNETLALVQSLSSKNPPEVLDWIEESTIRLFDLREVWLRIIGDCRLEDDGFFEEE